jgi:hypothetical protein
MYTQHQHLIEVEIRNLRPTQITVGRAEVETKRREWRSLGRKARIRLLALHWFPTVIGPKGRHYIVDHHHLGLALLEEGVRAAWSAVLRDWSGLDAKLFWRVMEFHQWAHPYDQTGARCSYASIPAHVEGLCDDPYRSLAGFVRNAGGYSKDATPYAEFLWADYFRMHITARLIRTSLAKAKRKAMALARHPEARYLPGWCGELDGS